VPERIAVFIDYQNVYRRAREAFGLETASHIEGQINPARLGLALKGMGVGDRELNAVRIYRGMPSTKHDARGYTAAQRQVALWEQHQVVRAITRPLNYGDPAQPKEKGIDVLIALDFVRAVVHDKTCDVAILFSGDTDLVPALEMGVQLRGLQAVEVAAWVPTVPGVSPRALRLPGQNMRIHYLNESWYRRLHDPTDYNARRRRR
jgi:uncharacterized LabA/DUF88 family protein